MRKCLSLLLIAILIFGCCGCKLLDRVQSGMQAARDELNEQFGGGTWVEYVDEDIVSLIPVTLSESDETTAYNYERLNADQKQIYCVMYTAAQEMTEGWFHLETDSENSSDDIVIAFQALTGDHPELFWLPSNYLLSNSGTKSDPDVVLAFSYHEKGYDYDYTVTEKERKKMQNKLETKADEILENLPNDAFEAELYLHDCICKLATYEENPKDSMVYTAYGALVNGRAVCEGYARAMQYLCQKAGIPCTLAVGEYNGDGHMWNYIRIGNAWYHLDITWDDLDDGPYYYYFNLTDKEIAADHTLRNSYDKVSGKDFNAGSFNVFKPNCNATLFNYYVYNDLVVATEDPELIALRIVLANQDGEDCLQFHFTDKDYLAKFGRDDQKTVEPIQNYVYQYSNGNCSINRMMTTDSYITFYWS